MSGLKEPFFPIIYVRGYAMTPSEVADTVATPYMGFNLGSTKVRQSWDGRVHRHVFESPLIRLMKDYGYRDIYADGTETTGPIGPRSVIIYRYYEPADADLGDGRPLSIPEAAAGLRALIHSVRDRVCGDDAEVRERFRVHLVAHSMGGLVCRAFLQNDDISSPEDRRLVDRVFTYASPHNGIEAFGINVPSVLGLWDINNFNREKMADYLGLPKDSRRVDSLNGRFDPDRFFCLVGTNHRDYEVALGMSRRLAGEMSDGLVRIDNAAVHGAPRAFVYRSHSGHYGVVNSEEGYQNLVRFLFGDLRVDGVLEVDALPLPPTVQKAHDEGRKVRASYYVESTVAPRGAITVRLTERRRETYSAVLRSFDELFKPAELGLDGPRSPVLFSSFLDTSRVEAGRTVVFSVEVAISTTGYTIDGLLWNQHIDGEYLFRDTITIRATPPRKADAGGSGPGGADWTVRYLLTDEDWSEFRGRVAEHDGHGFLIPLSSRKGFRASLCLRLSAAR